MWSIPNLFHRVIHNLLWNTKVTKNKPRIERIERIQPVKFVQFVAYSLNELFQPELGFAVMPELPFFDSKIASVDHDAYIAYLRLMFDVEHLVVHHVFANIMRNVG